MSFQGKQLPAEMVEAVVRLKKHYNKERKAGQFVSTKDPAKRTTNALGIGVASVKSLSYPIPSFHRPPPLVGFVSETGVPPAGWDVTMAISE